MMARTPDLSCTCSELTSKPSRESISSWFSTRSALPDASGAVSKVAAALGAASSVGAGGSSAMLTVLATQTTLLNDHFLEQHVAHLVRRGCHIDPAQQFFFQPQHAG